MNRNVKGILNKIKNRTKLILVIFSLKEISEHYVQLVGVRMF